MDIFPKLLSDKDFMYFTEGDYYALGKVLDEVTASYLLGYINHESADSKVKEDIQTYLGTTISSLTFHVKLKESGLVDLVRNLSPESLAVTDVDLDNLIDRLSFLEENVDKIRTIIPARNAKDYQEFYACMSGVVARMALEGNCPTYPDVLERIKANKFLFYTTGEKDHPTGVGIINSKRRQWTIALNGARWLKYCKENGVDTVARRKF